MDGFLNQRCSAPVIKANNSIKLPVVDRSSTVDSGKVMNNRSNDNSSKPKAKENKNNDLDNDLAEAYLRNALQWQEEMAPILIGPSNEDSAARPSNDIAAKAEKHRGRKAWSAIKSRLQKSICKLNPRRRHSEDKAKSETKTETGHETVVRTEWDCEDGFLILSPPLSRALRQTLFPDVTEIDALLREQEEFYEIRNARLQSEARAPWIATIHAKAAEFQSRCDDFRAREASYLADVRRIRARFNERATEDAMEGYVFKMGSSTIAAKENENANTVIDPQNEVVNLDYRVCVAGNVQVSGQIHFAPNVRVHLGGANSTTREHNSTYVARPRSATPRPETHSIGPGSAKDLGVRFTADIEVLGEDPTGPRRQHHPSLITSLVQTPSRHLDRKSPLLGQHGTHSGPQATRDEKNRNTREHNISHLASQKHVTETPTPTPSRVSCLQRRDPGP